MKREIKFRWFDKRTKTMINNPYTIIYPDGSLGLDNPTRDLEWIEQAGQFTGLKDKNGVDIYEGDIIGHNQQNFVVVFTKRFGYVFVVINENLKNILTDNMLMMHHNYRDIEWFERVFKYTEIIGNIHQNPELCSTQN